ncbi:MAG: hypothetical protein J5915_04570 [Acidaminococcaceae bacterium]|nr:hypothetical protein [Acidaminococcaceae bacterium]
MKYDWKRKCNKAKFLALAAALLASSQAGSIGEAAAPEKQLSLIAEQRAVWGSGEKLAESVRDDDLVAVTDLDGNGRLELFFLKFVRNPVPHANDKGTNEEKGRALVASVPVTMRPRGYEVSADGKGLEELSFRYSDAIIPPNLIQLGEAFYNGSDKTRIYKLATLNRVGELGFRLYWQSLSLQGGTVTVQALGTEVGGYGLFAEMPTAEAVTDHCEDRFGKPVAEGAFNNYIASKFAGMKPAMVKANWISAKQLADAATSQDKLRAALEESWKEFRFELKDDSKKKNEKKK